MRRLKNVNKEVGSRQQRFGSVEKDAIIAGHFFTRDVRLDSRVATLARQVPELLGWGVDSFGRIIVRYGRSFFE